MPGRQVRRSRDDQLVVDGPVHRCSIAQQTPSDHPSCEDRRMDSAPVDGDAAALAGVRPGRPLHRPSRLRSIRSWPPSLGVIGYDDRMTDYSPAGIEERAALDRQTLVELASLDRLGRDDELAAAYLAERLGTSLALVDADEPLRDINNLASPVQAIRDVFDVMAYESVSDWEIAARRMEAVPGGAAGPARDLRGGAVARHRGSPAPGARGGRAGVGVVRRTGAGAVLRDARRPGPTGWTAWAARCAPTSTRPRSAASMAYGELAEYLRTTYAPDAAESDAVGAERYAMLARGFLGAEVDLAEAYEWGWDELGRIEADMVEPVRPDPTGCVDRRDRRLARDRERPGRRGRGRAARLAAGAHGHRHRRARRHPLRHRPAGAPGRGHDRPARRRGGDVLHGPVGGLLPPRPHLVPVDRAAAVPRCGARSPPRTTRACPAITSRWPRSCSSASTSAGCSAWASSPGTARAGRSTPSGSWTSSATSTGPSTGSACWPPRRCGRCGSSSTSACTSSSRSPRCSRRPRRRSTPASAGRPTSAGTFLYQRSRHPETFMASEIVRYLGWPGQAISYKVGERVWLEARADARAAPRRRVRPEGLPRLRPRPRPARPRPPPHRARPLLSGERDQGIEKP